MLKIRIIEDDILLNLSLKSPSKWINHVDNGLGNDKVSKEMCANKDIYFIIILF